jgi:hypothetical protein
MRIIIRVLSISKKNVVSLIQMSVVLKKRDDIKILKEAQKSSFDMRHQKHYRNKIFSYIIPKDRIRYYIFLHTLSEYWDDITCELLFVSGTTGGCLGVAKNLVDCTGALLDE